MPEDLKLSQISSSPLLPPFRGLHSPGVWKHCQISFTCYFLTLSISAVYLHSNYKYTRPKLLLLSPPHPPSLSLSLPIAKMSSLCLLVVLMFTFGLTSLSVAVTVSWLWLDCFRTWRCYRRSNHWFKYCWTGTISLTVVLVVDKYCKM